MASRRITEGGLMEEVEAGMPQLAQGDLGGRPCSGRDDKESDQTGASERLSRRKARRSTYATKHSDQRKVQTKRKAGREKDSAGAVPYFGTGPPPKTKTPRKKTEKMEKLGSSKELQDHSSQKLSTAGGDDEGKMEAFSTSKPWTTDRNTHTDKSKQKETEPESTEHSQNKPLKLTLRPKQSTNPYTPAQAKIALRRRVLWRTENELQSNIAASMQPAANSMWAIKRIQALVDLWEGIECGHNRVEGQQEGELILINQFLSLGFKVKRKPSPSTTTVKHRPL
ncbi:unnamed protein product [Ranitomeya imitator]|uniref:Uncharacterized protein n=1 Tax=Ranitomeya imitator TaxID=111125 RepID=A0ABN9KRV1_9NEOB|nr:unnamed protein product [Ranitomeya imitator]